MSDEPIRIKLRHYAYNEGHSAAHQGYTGANPYAGNYSPAGKVCRGQWARGFTDAVVERLKENKTALGEK